MATLLIKSKIYLLLLSLISVSAQLYGAELSSMTATQLYLKGYSYCLEANRLRYINLLTAKNKYQTYLDYKAKAIQLDSHFLATSDPLIRSNLNYCDAVSNNLALTEAQPLMEKGLTACFAAKQAQQKNNTTSAKQYWAQYQSQKNAALQISDQINRSTAMIHRIQQCDALGKTLNTASPSASTPLFNLLFRQQAAQTSTQQQASELALEAAHSCLSVQTLIRDPRFKNEDATIAIHAVQMSKRFAAQAQTALEKMPSGINQEEVQQVNQQLFIQARCLEKIQITTGSISTANKNDRVIPFNNITQDMETAIELCEAARVLLANNNNEFSVREKAYRFFEESAQVFSGAQKDLSLNQKLAAGSKEYQKITKLTQAYHRCEDTRPQ